MVKDMAKWKDFSAAQCPQAIISHEIDILTGMTQGDAGNDYRGDIHNSMIADIPRDLFIINGTRFHHHNDPEAGILPALRNAVPDNKALRFLSTIMHQGAWGDIVKVGCQTAQFPPDFYRNTTFVTRPLAPYDMQMLLGQMPQGGHYDLIVSPDRKTARLSMTRQFNLNPGGPFPGMYSSSFGRVELTQELTISLEGEPRITGYALSQKLIDSPRGEL